MKLMTCILFAGLALGSTFTHATETNAVCTAAPGGKWTSDRSPLDLFSTGGKAPQPSSSGAASAR